MTKSKERILICLADELFQEACEGTLDGEYRFSFEEIQEKAEEEFETILIDEDCFKIMDLIYEFNSPDLITYPEYYETGFELDINMYRVRGYIEEKFFLKEVLEDYYEKEKWLEKYLKEHKIQYGDNFVIANGEWYETLSLKQSERIFQSYAVWLYRSGRR